MELSKQELTALIASVVKETISQLNLVNAKPNDNGGNGKSAYQKTEQLLYNYNGFLRIIREREQEIENLQKYGIPGKSGSVVAYKPHTGVVSGIVLKEESVEEAINVVRRSTQATVEALALIDKHMAALKNDPYYTVLEKVYFQGRTQEDIALELKCSQVTISKNKNRLVKELSLRLFPDQAINEMMQ